MAPLTGKEIRDFKVRGNYINQRSLLRREGLLFPKGKVAPRDFGYSPPVVEYEFADGTSGSVVVREFDIPVLCQDDEEAAKNHLALILNADRDHAAVATKLSSAAQPSPSPLLAPAASQPKETNFVVPCTSSQAHS
jgi:hypothetical protein